MPDQATRLLVIDDDPAEIVLLRRHLDKVEGHFEVTASHDVSQAKQWLREREFDLVFLDFHLTNTTGLDVLLEIQAQTSCPPVVMLTGQGDQGIAVETLKAGASDYLPKDKLSATSLTRVISHTLEKHRLQVLVDQHRARLEQANADLQRKHSELQGFYHTVSHELKTPLTSALEFVSLVIEGHAGPTTAEQQDFLGVALDSCRQIVHYVDDMLDVTRLETGKMSVQRKPTEIGPFVERAAESLMSCAEELGINLETRIAEDLPAADIDERRVAQVLRNLINNALKFTPSGGRIVIEVCLDGQPGMLRVAVRDTGRGIPADKIAHIFDRLAQVHDDDYETHGGLGLGLSICHEIVQIHDGTLTVESQVGDGSTFAFTLVASGAAPSPQANAATPTSA